MASRVLDLNAIDLVPWAPEQRVEPRLELERSEHTYLVCKRALDVVVAGLALLILAPLLLLTALLIKLQDGGPVLFEQERVGKGGRRFRMLKFRSMVPDAEKRRAALLETSAPDEVHDARRFKSKRDPRITPVGRVIRKLSVDELPQLWNVLRGDLTLVGPRPAIPEEVRTYDRRARRRLEVEQGITCLWQVNGRSLLSFDRQVELDIEYIEKRSLLFDLELLARTVPAVLSGRGAC